MHLFPQSLPGWRHLPGLLLLTAVLSLASVSGDAAEFKAGVAVVDITSPPGFRMSGYFYERLNTGTHDPLHAKAIVFEQGKEKAALVFCDLIGMDSGISGPARERASHKTGIPVANILISGTHSHTGPLYGGALREYFHERAIATQGKDPYETIDYRAQLTERLVQAIVQAQADAKPVMMEAGVGHKEGLSFNRRFHMKDGTVRFNPGKMNPDIIAPAGPIDPEVGFILFRTADGKSPFASITSFALHLDTVGGTEYSADYPYYLERSLRKLYGENLVSLFGTGTCGDINHVDVTNKLPQKGQEEADRIGTALGEVLKSVAPELKAVAQPSLGVRTQKIDVPLQQYSAEEIANAKQKMEQVGSKAVPFLVQVEICKVYDLGQRNLKSLPLEVQVFRLGADTAIVGLPGEVFVELGLAIKQGSPFKNTLIVELTNEGIAYVPTQKAFAEGSYEIVNSRVQSGGGEKLAETAVKLLRELQK